LSAHLQQPPVASQRRLNLQRRDLTVRGRLDHTRHMNPLVRIYPDDDHAELLFTALCKGTVDDTPTLS
jgi:hypothetical protein